MAICMKELSNLTIAIIDTVNYGEAVFAMEKSLALVKPARAIFFTDIEYVSDKFETIIIPKLKSKSDYSWWVMKELGKQGITTSHILLIQHDGYILDENAWTDEFLKYSYLGAPWLYSDNKNCGNGGFSLRETRLHEILSQDDFILPMALEDDAICRTYRNYLEQKYGFTWAPDELANKFSFELREPTQPTFGFHGKFHEPYRKYIVISRLGALGDVIQTEPILEYYYNKGYNVVIDCHPTFYYLWMGHRFKVILYQNFDHTQIQHEVINLEMAYEIKPKQLHLQSYFEACGIKDYILRNPILNYDIGGNKLFKRYVVIHIDQRETKHRNIYGVRWSDVVLHLENLGYDVIQIGVGVSEEVALHMNTSNPSLMYWLIAGCEFLIGADSGPSHIATALGKKCVLFFGSVDPEVIHHDRSNMITLQSDCPIGTPNCWTNTIGQRGLDCLVPNAIVPPCTVISTERVIDAIDKVILL